MEEKVLVKYVFIDKQVLDKYHIYPSYIKMVCTKCDNSWGITLDPGRKLTERDFICSRCLMDDYLEKNK
jgi:hypothetical protein